MITVYGTPLSPYVRKVLMTLEYKQLDYGIEPFTPLDPPAGYEAISPLKKVPGLRHGDFTISDSSVIIRYLEDSHPRPSLYPEDVQLRARAGWFEEYGDTRCMDVMTTFFFERFVKPNFMSATTDEALLARVQADDVPAVCDYLEQVAPGTGYLCGADLSVGDLAIGSAFVSASYGGLDVDAARWPQLARYVGRLLAAPPFSTRIQAEQQMMAP